MDKETLLGGIFLVLTGTGLILYSLIKGKNLPNPWLNPDNGFDLRIFVGTAFFALGLIALIGGLIL